ncbi:MAG TPA: hypothetical protein VGR45_02375 [Stellaceae bacterium]|nr:hypothetical protein [Stellaceae bacterium]
MADIETSVAITAQTDDLQSGMRTAASSVETATEAMKAQFVGLGAAAQQAQSQIGAAAAQIGSTIGALQARAANLAGSASSSGTSATAPTLAGAQGKGISVTLATGGGQSGGGQNRLQEWRAELQSQLSAEQAFFNDSKAEELAFWQDKLALTSAGSKEQLAVENNIYQLEKQLAVQNERDSLASLDADEKITTAAYARKKAAIQDAAELGRVSASQEIAQLKELLDTEWALEQDYYEKKLAAATGDARTQEKLTAEEELAYQKYLTDKQKLDTQAVQDSQKQWAALLQPIQRALDTSITGIIMGTTTVQKALSNLAQSIIAEFVNSAVQSVLGGLGKLLGASLVGGGGGGSSGDQDFWGGGSSGDQDFWGGVTGAGEDIVGGGISEGLFGSGGLLGALSLGSLFSGGGIFGSLFKGVSSLFGFEHGGIVPSAAGGWMVPSASLAMLHTNEMVLPADISQGLQSMIAGGGSGGGANVLFNVSAMDSQSVAKFFQSNGNILVAAINRAMRNGASLRSA